MKRVFYFMNIVLLAGLLTASCSKDEENTDNRAVEEEVVDDIAASMGSSNSGISSEIVDVAFLADEYMSQELKSASSDTIYSVDTSFTRKNPSGAKITYNYSYQVEYGIILGTTDKLFYDGIASGTYDSPRISSTDSRTSDWELTGLDISSSAYTLNGSIERTGDSVSKVRNKSQTSSNAQITLSNVKINKSTLSIIEGTLTWSTTGQVNSKSYNYNVTIVYLGNGKAELTLNSVKYTIDITSGEVD